MNTRIIVALVVVAFAVATQATVLVKKTVKKSELTSADVEALLDPTVHSLANGQHKLVYKGESGKEQCVVCQPFQGCGCRDVVAIRCELKRLKQKLLRLKRIAQPHKRSHHERVEKPKVKPAVKPLIQPLIKPAVQPLIQPLIRPAVQPLIKVAVQPAEQPAVQPAEQPLIKVAVQPAEQPVVKPAVVNLV